MSSGVGESDHRRPPGTKAWVALPRVRQGAVAEGEGGQDEGACYGGA